MRHKLLFAIALILGIISCTKEEEPEIIVQGDFPVKEYYLERDPSINVWGAGIDFIHTESSDLETYLDYKYLNIVDSFPMDVKFYVVKVAYYDSKNDLKVEGFPAVLLSDGTQAVKLGEGVSFFDSLTIITSDMTSELTYDEPVDYDSCKDKSSGYYMKDTLNQVLNECVIGAKFRTQNLVITDDISEQDIQPVFLIKPKEGGLVKFMIKQFKGPKPYQKQTMVRWQVISE